MATAALKLRGLVAPVFTPMHADGSLNLDRVEAQAEHLKGQGVVGVFVAGTTGEGLSLNLSERRQLTERWCAVANGKFPVISHVGHVCLSDAKDLAEHAQQAGATAIAAVPPFYYSADRVDDECLCQDDHPHTSSTGEATRHWPGAREILRGEAGKAAAHNCLRLLEPATTRVGETGNPGHLPRHAVESGLTSGSQTPWVGEITDL